MKNHFVVRLVSYIGVIHGKAKWNFIHHSEQTRGLLLSAAYC